MLKRAPQTFLRKGVQPTRLSLQRRFAVMTQVVPLIGDSITEGTVIEWNKQVGEAVKVDDIVARIETDKVVVEIRAEGAGVITAHHAELEGTVEVGAKLFTLDTDGTASVSSDAAATPTPSAPTPTPKSTPAPAAASSKPQPKPPVASAAPIGRHPMIQFRYGKRDPPPRVATAASSISPAFVGPDEYFSVSLPSRFERKVFSEEEIDATLSGGAWLVDQGFTQTISKRLDL